MTFGDSVLGAAAATFDRAVVAAVRLRTKTSPSRSERLSHDERMDALAKIRAAYDRPEHWRDPDAYFTPPAPIAPALARVRVDGEVTVSDASWRSAFAPFLPELRDKYLGHENNRTARARVYLGARPRPVCVLLHGYLAGQWAVEERAWPIGWLTRHFDVAIAVLPFHAVRARTDRRGPPPFPGADPRFTNEGFRQAMHDIRALVAWLRARGAPSVGVMGMSLGGYTTALLATVEPSLAFAAPIIPLASIADFARDQGRLGSGAEEALQHRALEDATRIVSPLARPSLLPKERVLVVAGDGDRITPMSHAERLARHFDARLVPFPGGHLLQFGRRTAFRELGRWMRETVGAR